MRSTFRSLCLGLLTLSAAASMAQNSVTVIGSVTPCSGTSYPVWIFSDPGTTPAVDTVINTTENCTFSYTFNPINTSGGISVLLSCDNGLTWGVADSAIYMASPVDTLMMNLGCGGTSCQASFTAQQAMNGNTPIPWQLSLSNTSTGGFPLSFIWWLPDGSISDLAEPSITFSQPGAYGICLVITADNGNCTSTFCDSVFVDDMGNISNGPIWYDCTGLLWGSDLPGTSCTDPLGNEGTWSSSCVCVADSTPANCQACFTTTQVAPFTAVFTSCSSGGIAPFVFTWDFSDASTGSGNPVTHVYQWPGTYTVCLNMVDANGNWCQICDSVVVGADGTINPSIPTPCHASFWAVQAYDSTDAGGVEPILNEVWVWNLSSGGNGSYQFLWNFGDGSTSTDAFPTHEYDGPGPWDLCLTIYSGGCTDSYCDSVGVDENGIFNGMLIDGHPADQDHRTNGFTLNVVQATPVGIAGAPALADLRLWPNPAQNELNLSFNNALRGTVSVTVLDPSGRLVISEDHNIPAGANALQVDTGTLEPGLYMVRIGNASHSVTHRFMKVR